MYVVPSTCEGALAVSSQLLERWFQDFSRDLSKSLNVHWPLLCRTFSKLLSAQDDVLKTSVAGFLASKSGFEDAAAFLAKKADSPDPPSSSGSFYSKATAVPSSSATLDVVEVLANVPLAKSTVDVNADAKNN